MGLPLRNLLVSAVFVVKLIPVCDLVFKRRVGIGAVRKGTIGAFLIGSIFLKLELLFDVFEVVLIHM
jgi:hypothetical protein